MAETEPRDEPGNDGSPPMKRLRSSVEDLKITLKWNDNDHGKAMEKTYEVHSQVYASHSKFIDTALSVNMRERETREVVFQDTTPELFDLAMKYLEDPLAVRQMKAQDALQVVQFYDKYEFEVGLKICDQVLLEAAKVHLNSLRFNTVAEELVNICVAAESFGLGQSKEECNIFLEGVLSGKHERPILTIEHCRKLHPIMMQNYSKLLQKRVGVTKEELESPLFPRVFVEYQSKQYLEGQFSALYSIGKDIIHVPPIDREIHSPTLLFAFQDTKIIKLGCHLAVRDESMYRYPIAARRED